MATSWNKKERENKKKEERKKKEEKKQDRKENAGKGKSLDEMMAYLDENGNLTTVPPDPAKRREINIDSIEIGVPKRAAIAEDAVRTGVVKFFNDKKGFGFIEETETGREFFVHQSASSDNLKESMKVNFEVEKGPRGLTAVRVSIAR